MSDSWRWQLRDAEGKWVKMGSRVSWLQRGRLIYGKVTGSPRPGYATVKPDNAPEKNIDTRRITVVAGIRTKNRVEDVEVPPEVRAGSERLVPPRDIKVGDWVRLPAGRALVPLSNPPAYRDYPEMYGKVMEIESRGRGSIIKVAGDGARRDIASNGLVPAMHRVTPLPARGTMRAAKGVVTMAEVETPEAKAARIRVLAKDTDTRLSAIYEQQWALRQELDRVKDQVLRDSGAKRSGNSWTGRTWDRSPEDARQEFRGQPWQRAGWDRAVARWAAIESEQASLAKEQAGLEAVWTENRWTRAFLVVNGDGHVHRSMSCSTCRMTTRFAWLPDYSGADESEIVGDAGERACTVCYPSAPVDVLRRPTKIFTEDERVALAAREKEREDRAARKAAQEAKALTAPDGSELRVLSLYDIRARTAGRRVRGEPIRSVVTARNAYIKAAAEEAVYRANGKDWDAYLPAEERQKILDALAAKEGRPVEEIRAELDAKVPARVKKVAKDEGLPIPA